MFTLSEVYDKTIVSVELLNEEKIVHLMGYGYCADDSSSTPYRFVEYTWFYVPAKRLKNEKIEDIEGTEAEYYKQNILDCNEDELLNIYLHYDNGNTPKLLKSDELCESTPCGLYVLI